MTWSHGPWTIRHGKWLWLDIGMLELGTRKLEVGTAGSVGPCSMLDMGSGDWGRKWPHGLTHVSRDTSSDSDFQLPLSSSTLARRFLAIADWSALCSLHSVVILRLLKFGGRQGAPARSPVSARVGPGARTQDFRRPTPQAPLPIGIAHRHCRIVANIL